MSDPFFLKNVFTPIFFRNISATFYSQKSLNTFQQPWYPVQHDESISIVDRSRNEIKSLGDPFSPSNPNFSKNGGRSKLTHFLGRVYTVMGRSKSGLFLYFLEKISTILLLGSIFSRKYVSVFTKYILIIHRCGIDIKQVWRVFCFLVPKFPASVKQVVDK